MVSKYADMKKPVQDQNFWTNLKKYCNEYTEHTGFHGIRYLSENRSTTEKVFWVCVLMAALAGCISMICQIIAKYESSPIVVTFASKGTPLSQIPFPAVTICPESKCMERNFNYSETYRRIFDSGTTNATELQLFYYISLVCNSFEGNVLFRKTSIGVNNDFYSIIDQLKPTEITECVYMGVDCMNSFTPVLTDEGICYSFNILDKKDMFKDHTFYYTPFQKATAQVLSYTNDLGYLVTAGIDSYPKRALLSGADNSLVINMKHYRYNTDFLCNKYLQGYKVQLHNPVQFPRLQKWYFHVPLDSTVIAAVEPRLTMTSKEVKGFKPKNRQCYLDNERFLYYFKTYTQGNCMLECETNSTLHNCGCVSYYMPRKNTTRICGSPDYDCIYNVTSNLKAHELENEISSEHSFQCDCMPSCTSLTYDVETSLGDNYLREYFAFTQAAKELDMENLHFSALSVYFKENEFITIERNELYGTSDFISNIGGLLGLFTGFSLISCTEILYFATMRIFYNFRLYGKWFGNVP